MAQPPRAWPDGSVDEASAGRLTEVQHPGLSRRQVLARTRLDFWLDGCILVVRPRGQDKLIYAVNLALLFAMTLCIASGIMISRVALPQMGFFLNSNLFWNRLHILTAEITLYLVPVHVALRWRWIVAVGRRLLGRAGRRGSR